jgi:hypothetical protein
MPSEYYLSVALLYSRLLALPPNIRLARDKYFSLLFKFVNYRQKCFITLGLDLTA